jgi:hypothetical protein
VENKRSKKRQPEKVRAPPVSASEAPKKSAPPMKKREFLYEGK